MKNIIYVPFLIITTVSQRLVEKLDPSVCGRVCIKLLPRLLLKIDVIFSCRIGCA